jgi:hypothetical protein
MMHMASSHAASHRSYESAETVTGITPPLTSELRRVSWGAILAGVVVALAIQILLAMLGAGIGLGVIEPTQAGDNPTATSMGIGAAAWWALSGIIAAAIGGWVAARLAGIPSREVGLLHGFATWATATLLVLYFLGSTAGAIIGGAFNVAGQTLSGLGNAVGNAASSITGDPLQAIQDQIRGTAANPNDPQAAGRQIADAMRRVLTGEGDQVEQGRQAAIDVMVRQGVPQDEAQRRIQGWEQQYNETVEQAEQQARAAADATADGIATAGFYGFFGLLLGAIAGALGGRAGTPSLLAARTTVTRT